MVVIQGVSYGGEMKKIKGLLGLLILGVGCFTIIYLCFHVTHTEFLANLAAFALIVYGSHIYLEA